MVSGALGEKSATTRKGFVRMEKEAWVVGIEGDQVRLRYLRHSACKNCGACSLMGEGEQEVLLPNDLDLQVGDRVEVGMRNDHFLQASLLLYGVPLIFLLLGYLAGEGLMRIWRFTGHEEVGGVVGGLLFLFLSYKGINLYDRGLQDSDQYQLKVSRIISRAAPPPTT